MKKIAIAVVLVGVLAISSTAAIGYMKEKISFFNLGQEIKKADDTADSAVAFIINGQEYKLKNYNIYKAGMQYGDSNFSDQEIFDRYVKQKLLLQEANRLGISVGKEEISAFTKQRMDLINNDSTLKKQLEDYLDGAGISMDDYIKLSDEASEQQLLYDKLVEVKKKDFPAETLVETQDESGSIQKNMDLYADQLRNEADIEIVDEQLKETVSIK